MQEDFSVQIRCVWSVFTSQLIFGVESQCFFSGVCSQLLLLSFHRWTPAGTARTRAPSCRGRDGRWIDEGICATLPQVHHHHHHHHQLAIALLCWTPATKTCPRPRKNSRLNIFLTLVCLFCVTWLRLLFRLCRTMLPWGRITRDPPDCCHADRFVFKMPRALIGCFVKQQNLQQHALFLRRSSLRFMEAWRSNFASQNCWSPLRAVVEKSCAGRDAVSNFLHQKYPAVFLEGS